MKEQEFIKQYDSIVLFDGVCNLCCSSVQFILRHDKSGIFVFTPLSSEAGKKLIAFFNYTIKPDSFPESIVLIQNNTLYEKSSAVLLIGKKLEGFKILSKIGFLFPKFIRDFIYSIIAKNRYRIFGKKESCMIPTPNVKKKFIETL